MAKKKTHSDQAADLRKRAENIALETAEQSPEDIDGQTPAEIRQTLHELRVHQIELDMQNEELRLQEEELRASQEHYLELYELAPVGYFILSEQGLILTANLTATTMLGITKSNLGKQTLSRFVTQEDQDFCYLKRIQLFKTREPQTFELRLVKKDGTKFWAHLDAIAAKDAGGATVCRITLSDITALKQVEVGLQERLAERILAEKNLQLSQSLLISMINSPQTVIIFSLDRDFRYLAFNAIHGQTMKALWGVDIQPGMHMTDIIGIESDKAKALRNFEWALTGEHFTLTEEYGDYGLERKIWENMYSPLYDVNHQIIGLTVCCIDVTDRKRAEDALRESEKRYRDLSILDDLTQLYNSRHFYHQLEMEIDRADRYGQPLTLLLLDLDDFKRFNDAFGHIEGDQVLLRLGQVVKRCLRLTDSAYRYGGEEFTIILPMTTSADGSVTAERIRTEFKKETFSQAPDQEVHMTMSIGLAQCNPQEEMKAFVHRVDQLMYQAKKNGKDRIYLEA
jgi:diguanylate cyclase (GGDEF)-like protein/PAS domain S-box-containing protein